jgi:hypothetical protein
MVAGLFLIHAVVGGFVADHGSQKVFGILGGYGLEGTGQYLEGFGLRPGKRPFILRLPRLLSPSHQSRHLGGNARGRISEKRARVRAPTLGGSLRL